MRIIRRQIAVALTLFMAACSQEPADIHYRSDECAHCKMMITDERFTAQLVTNKGKAIKFDAIECMAAYKNAGMENLTDAKYWVSNFDQPGQWLAAERAHLVKSEVIQSPMGESLLAFPSAEISTRHIEEYPGRKLSWNDLINL